MRIKKLEIKNFKRFSDLTIQDIPESAKLVLLIGSNGSGKSSVFDAFNFINNQIKGDMSIGSKDYQTYFRKDDKKGLTIDVIFDQNQSYSFANNKLETPLLADRSFYGRTSFRQLTRLTRTARGQSADVSFENDSDRPRFFIDRDNRFENDIDRISEAILREVFLTSNSNEAIKQRFIEPINRAFYNIFGRKNGTKLELVEIIPPLDNQTAQVTFRKGVSTFHYNYLGAGEKEVFNLLVNLLSRSALHQDTIYYLDEIDLHLNTQLQFNLLKEITENWLPENCQLWTASHSLGFIEYAKKSEHAVIFDFDDLDFDHPRTLVPELKENPDMYEIAIGKDILPSLFKQMNVYFVENNDRNFYASVNIPKTVFISDHNRNSVYYKVKATQIKGIVDRDFLTDDDIIEINKEYPKLFILKYYSIENYLYHPDNLAAYHQAKGSSFDKKSYIEALIGAKNEVKNQIILKIASIRSSYPYFSEPNFNGESLQNRFKISQDNFDQSATIQSYLESDELEVFYKSLPMKDYCKHLAQRQNIPKTELAKTDWFRQQISNLLH